MMLKYISIRLLSFVMVLSFAALPALGQNRAPPYWASINRAEAIMRRGPSSEMPAMWAYRRVGLPLRVVAVRGDWRQVRDPDGTTGWMHKRLLTGTRTAIVIDGTQSMHESPSADAVVSYRVEAGVVGRLGECRNGYCDFDVRGQTGWIAADGIWGEGA
ncbi:MAG: SH3 domain-containing protein [Sphingopyxis sp.]